MSEKPKKDLTFDEMYGRLENRDTPEKVSGTPVCRSERGYLEGLEESMETPCLKEGSENEQS